METIKQKERRRAQRKKMNDAFLDVFRKDEQYLKEYKGKICDLSTLGVKFVSNRPQKMKSKIYIGLLLPNEDSLIYIPAKVVRCEQKNAKKHYIALEFDENYYQQSLILEYMSIMT
jgi:hypothetical protein